MARTANPTPALTFESTEVPETVSTTTNPFAEAVAGLAEKWDDDKGQSAGALSVTVPAEDGKRLAAKISEAARSIDKSARVRFFDKDNKPLQQKALPAKGDVRMTFWLKPASVKDETAEQDN